jgi:site-specific recombinase XerC
MESLSPSTINVRLSAVRKLVGEAQRAGMIGQEEAASLNEVPNISQKGTRLGNWLTREQAKELLAVPDRATLKGKRDYVILALLVGCALRRKTLSAGVDIRAQRNRAILEVLIGCGLRRAESTPMHQGGACDIIRTLLGVVKWASRSVFVKSHGRVRRRLPGSCAFSSSL